MIKILIVDDHPVVRQGLKQILSEEPDMVVTGEARNSSEVFNLVQLGMWDIVILDITIPGRGGLDVLKELRQTYPHLPVLMLSIHPEDQYAIRSLKAGASGYMTKESAPEELVKAIRKIIDGGKYVSPAVADQLVFDLQFKRDKVPHELLSDREYHIMLMIASGKKIGLIADEMALSVKTISTYRARILEKMRLQSNAEITSYALRNGLVEL
jgi:two-component system, NarL family, invasion response regulator UvrY